MMKNLGLYFAFSIRDSPTSLTSNKLDPLTYLCNSMHAVQTARGSSMNVQQIKSLKHFCYTFTKVMKVQLLFLIYIFFLKTLKSILIMLGSLTYIKESVKDSGSLFILPLIKVRLYEGDLQVTLHSITIKFRNNPLATVK